jgi:formylglycine-generating enzyme required for sulfatase activity
MFKKVLLMFAIVMMVVSVAYARDVSVTNVSISNVNPSAGTCTINYTLTRTQPAIDANQPIWVFVKYRLSTDTDYTGWQDTDDHTVANDDSEGRFTGNNGSQNAVSNTVNKYLAGDVGIVTSGGSKQITWNWGATGTNLSSTDSVRVRVYAVEMVLVPDDGSMTFGTDTSADLYITSGSYDPSSAYYLMKYPCTTEMYAAFLNCCANRHDGSADGNHDFYNAANMTGDQYCRLSKTSGDISTQNAVFAANSGDEDYAMTFVNWWNAYDWAKWAGLRMPTEEEFEYEASNKGAWDFPWGDDAPTGDGGGNVRCNMSGVSPSNASDVRTYDEGVQDPNKSGLSVHNAAEMSGNVLEWEFTRYYTGSYNSDYSTDSDTYAGYGGSSLRVDRGGSWANDASGMRAASRHENNPWERATNLGFRSARTF